MGLFTNTKTGENHAEQVVCGEFAGDGVELLLRQTQLFGEQFKRGQLLASQRNPLAGFDQSAQVTLTGNENILGRMPASDLQQCLAQQGVAQDVARRFLADLHRFGDLNDDRTGRVAGKDRLQQNCNVIMLDYSDNVYTIIDETKIFY